MPRRPNNNNNNNNNNRSSSTITTTRRLRKKNIKNNKNDDDTDDNAAEFVLVCAAEQALLEAVVGVGVHGDDDDNSDDKMMDRVVQQFVDLYCLDDVKTNQNNTNHTNTYINEYYLHESITTKQEQRQYIHLAIQQNQKRLLSSSKFFEKLHQTTKWVIEQLQFFRSEEEEAVDGETNENDNDNNEQPVDDDHIDDGASEMIVDETAASSKKLYYIQFLTCVSMSILSFIQGIVKKKNKTGATAKMMVVPAAVMDIAILLHGILEQINDIDMNNNNNVDDENDDENIAYAYARQHAHETIIRMCEYFWIQSIPGKEQVIVQALPPLITNILNSTVKKSDIKRLLNIKSALQCIDYDDEDSIQFRHLVLCMASSPLMLKSVEGKQILSYLLTNIPELRKDVHASIRAQIPGNQKEPVLVGCGDVYYNAWMKAAPSSSEDDDSPDDDYDDDNNGYYSCSSSSRKAIEEDILQDLVYSILHGANRKLVHNVHIVLDKFHNNKKSPDIESLLHRLYGPILWRCLLSATNAKVRVNACHVLSRVFPLRQSNQKKKKQYSYANNNNKAGNNSSSSRPAIQKSVAAIQQVLHDPDARVRVAASEMVADILSMYWDILSTNDIRTFLHALVAEHASDASSAAVRASAVRAITTILDNPHSHPVLRDMFLPNMGNLLHDKTEMVRLAVVEMLFKIKKIPNIKYYHIVPVEHLTARMVAEPNPTNHVAAGLTELMSNSYFPINSNTDILERCLKFLHDDPDAAIVFYSNIYQFRSLDKIVPLLVNLLKILKASIEQRRQNQQQQQSRLSSTNGKRRRLVDHDTDDSDDDDNEEDDSILPLSVLTNVAVTIEILWQSIESDIAKYDEWNRFLTDEFSGRTLTNLLSYFGETLSSVSDDDDDNDDDDDEEGNMESVREDCHRASAALLQCASRLPSQSVQGMVPYISSMLRSVPADGSEDHNNNNNSSLTLHVALLCLWDMTDDVATCLANSIRSAYKNTLFGSPVADSKKRRGPSRRSASKDDTSLPSIPSLTAIRVLREIFAGSDPNSSAAREALLNSQRASDTIEKALEDGTRHAERVLAGDATCGLPDDGTENKFLLQVCDAYGRFALHREAASSTNGSVSFSDQATLLLHWTTTKIVPALKPNAQATMVPFNDPNLSSIQVEKSFDTFLPSSPEESMRPRRRVNRNTTPQRLDEGISIIDENSPTSELTSGIASTLRRAFAISLMQSSCSLFSDWLAVGGEGAAFIGQAAQKWVEIFKDDDSFSDLVTPFSRLAMQLAKTAEDFSVLKQLLTYVSDDPAVKEESSTLRKHLAMLLSNRGAQADGIITQTVQAALQVANDLLLQDTEAQMDYELSTSIGTLWAFKTGSICTAFSAILGSRAASLELGGQLVSRFTSSSDTSCPPMALFCAKGLGLLCDRDCGSKVVTEVSTMVRDLDMPNDLDGALGNLFEELVDGLRT